MMHDDYVLKHSGVKGMHWGEWNAETAARYAREKVGSAKNAVKGRIEQRKKDKKAAKETGYDKLKDYRIARKRALYSHDPEIVSKHVATLTDTELENKLKRLRLEKQVADLVPPKTKSLGERSIENFSTSFAKSFGTKLGPEIATAVGQKLTKKKNGNGNPSDADASSKKFGDIASSVISSTVSNAKVNNAKTNESTINNVAQAASRVASSTQSASTNNSPSPSVSYNITLFSAADVSSSTRSKGASTINSVKDEPIDIVPVSASSERQARSIMKRFRK